MRVRLDLYDEFKAQAGANQVYYTWDQKLDSPEAALFFTRAMVGSVTIEFWCEVKPPTFDQDFPNAIEGEMES